MGENYSEEGLKALGFVEDAKGNWSKPSNRRKEFGVSARARDSNEVPKHKQNVREPKRSAAAKERSKKDSQESYKQGEYAVVVTSYEIKSGNGSDTDNVCPKWFIDEIIKSDLLPADLVDDSFEHICLTIKAIKRVKTRKEQKTVIKFYKIMR